MKIFLSAALAILVTSWSTLLGQDTGAFTTKVRPVLAKHCFSCHNAKLTFANLNLETLSEEGHGAAWSKVREKVIAGKMPPPGQAQLSKSDLSAITSWIDGLTKPIETASAPGRVMARRLNRVEYNNTIRDLLGVPGRPADEFPVDDSGYGFDNIARRSDRFSHADGEVHGRRQSDFAIGSVRRDRSREADAPGPPSEQAIARRK